MAEMTFPWLGIVSAALAYMIGSLPLGAWWIRFAAGRDPRDVDAGRLGVENVFRLLGPPVAAVSFMLDIAKGAIAVVLLPVPEAAAVAVLVGHLVPIPWPSDARAPRGRGNGVLLGALAALLAAGIVPVAAALLAAAGYGAVLARWGYATPATLTAVALVGLWPGGAMWTAAGWFVAILVRGLPALARIMDGTEPRLGEPPPVRGLAPTRIRAAFMIHPLDVDDLWQVPSQRWAHVLHRNGLLPERWLRKALPWLRPQVHGILRGVELADGRTLEVVLIGGPMLPDQIREHPDAAVRMAIRGAELAREVGAEAFGLGAYWSTVGNRGRDVQEAVPDLPVTHGGSYTAATVQSAVPRLLERYRLEGGTLRQATAAVVGANGVVAFGVARLLAPEVGTLILIGTDQARLDRSAATLRSRHPRTSIRTSIDPSDIGEADLVFTATNTPGYVVGPEHVRPGAWVYDLGRPADVDPAVRSVPGVELVPGGVVRPPGRSVSDLDLHFGDGLVPACLAETMILAACGDPSRATTGATAPPSDIAWFRDEGERLGFDVVTHDDRVARATSKA